MLIRGATKAQILQATAATPGVRIDKWSRGGSDAEGLTAVNKRGDAFRVKLRTDGPKPKYGRVSIHYRTGKARRIPGCLCWHGFRDWMRALYKLSSDAKIETGVITYQDARDFEARHRETYYHNAGSQVAPVYFGSTCECGGPDARTPDDPPLPLCAQSMHCYCAGHARGLPASEPCDTREGA